MIKVQLNYLLSFKRTHLNLNLLSHIHQKRISLSSSRITYFVALYATYATSIQASSIITGVNGSNHCSISVIYVTASSYQAECDDMAGVYVRNGSFLANFRTCIVHHLEKSSSMKQYRELLNQKQIVLKKTMFDYLVHDRKVSVI